MFKKLQDETDEFENEIMQHGPKFLYFCTI